MLRVFLSDRKRPKMKNVAQRRRESHRSYFFLLLPSGWHVVAARSSRWPHVWKRPFWSAGCFTPTGFFYALCPCLIQCCCFHSPQKHLDKLQRPEGRWRRRHTANFFPIRSGSRCPGADAHCWHSLRLKVQELFDLQPHATLTHYW